MITFSTKFALMLLLLANKAQATTNSTTNNTITSQGRTYTPIYTVFPHQITFICTTLYVIIAIPSIIGNIIVLDFDRSRRKEKPPTSPHSSKRIISKYFLRSLALSDLLAGVVCCPIGMAIMYFDIGNGACNLSIFLLFLLQGITVYNLLIIAAERYLAVYHPFYTPSRRLAKILLIAAWILGFVRAGIVTHTHKLHRRNIGDDRYTLLCTYENVKLYQQVIHAIDLFITFAASNVFLLFVASSLARFQKKRKQRLSQGPANTYIDKAQAWRFKNTSLFMNVIFAFSVPYSVYFLYSVTAKLAGVRFSLETDTTIRLFSAWGFASNSAVNPFVYLYFSSELRQHVKGFVGKKKSNTEGC